MFKRGLLTIGVLTSLLFFSLQAVTFSAEWTTMDPGITRDFYSVWGSAADNVYVVGTFGIILRYDGNSEGTWEDQGKHSG